MATKIGEEAKLILFVAAYRKMVSGRLGGKPCRIKIENELARDVVRGLDVRLIKVFVEAQFSGLPADFCRDKFKRPYPPFNVICGGKCWQRYEEYLSMGVRDGQ